MIEACIAKGLLADADVTGKLGKYKDTPSIFRKSVVPPKAEYPAILVVPVTGRDFGTRDQIGGSVQIDVKLFHNRDQKNDKEMRELALAIWQKIDRDDDFDDIFDEAGFESCGLYADPPIDLHDEDGFPGFLIRVRADILVKNS